MKQSGSKNQNAGQSFEDNKDMLDLNNAYSDANT